MPGFTAPKMLWVAAHEPEDRQGDEARAAAQGLCAPAALGRGGVRDVRRLWHALARCRAAALGRNAAGGDRPHRKGHAAPGCRVRKCPPISRRKSLPPGAGDADPDRRRGRRQRRLGDRRRRHGARGRLRFARHIGRHLFRHRPFRRIPSGRCTRSAMRCRIAGTAWQSCSRPLSSLAWIAGVLGREDEIGKLIGWGGRVRACRPALSLPRRFSSPISAASARPTTTLAATRQPSRDCAPEHGADALVFAVMEGVAFSFADGVDVLDAAARGPSGRCLSAVAPDRNSGRR